MEKISLREQEQEYNLDEVRKKYNQLLIPIVWRRLAEKGIDNADSMIGTRDTIDDQDFDKFWNNIALSDLEEYKAVLQKRLHEIDSKEVVVIETTEQEAPEMGEFNPETGEFEVIKKGNVDTENVTKYHNASNGEMTNYTSFEGKEKDLVAIEKEIKELDYLISSL